MSLRLSWLAALICVAALLCIIGPGLAHDAGKGFEYPWECCHDHDCAEISESRVKPMDGGYLVDGKFPVAQADVRYSPDGRYRACFPNPDKLRCLFVPPSGS